MNDKFWVLLAGFSRNFEVTIPSLIQRTVLPLKERGNLAGLTVHLAEKQSVAREIVELHARSILGADIVFEFRTENEAEINASIASQYQRVARRGNIYRLSRPIALHRSVFFLELLDRARVALGDKALPIVFVRADLFQKTDADLVDHHLRAPHAVKVPDWHSWRGVNDRVAVIPAGLTSAYLGRIRELDSYLTDHGIFHPEVFLSHVLRAGHVERTIDAKYYRTRDGGLVVEEDFLAEPSRLATFAHQLLDRIPWSLPLR